MTALMMLVFVYGVPAVLIAAGVLWWLVGSWLVGCWADQPGGANLSLMA